MIGWCLCRASKQRSDSLGVPGSVLVVVLSCRDAGVDLHDTFNPYQVTTDVGDVQPRHTCGLAAMLATVCWSRRE
jgi:hypothetical protein